MAFAKFLLLAAIIIAVALALFLRVRAWRTRRAAKRAAWDAALARSLRELD